MGLPGSVAHLFEHLAVFSFAGTDGDHILESLLTAEVDVNDVECENGKITVFAPSTEYGKARQALQELLPDIKLDFDEVTFIPFARTEISGDDVAVFEKFITMLEDCEDVQDIYHNATLPESSES
jgi:transcriptional/translational regulatory protein YebC/TACO1